MGVAEIIFFIPQTSGINKNHVLDRLKLHLELQKSLRIFCSSQQLNQMISMLKK